MAKVTPASAAPKKEPKEPIAPTGVPIEYLGEGAEKIKFTVDPRATSIRVYADGRILVDY